jgi:hypothetical protein
MTRKIDKIIVTNVAALREKYGAKGLTAIRAAIHRLVEADSKRGLRTVLIDVSSTSQMRSVSGIAVVDPKQCDENKKAIDAIYRAHTPDYILILGSRDVIPHQDIKNPLFTNADGEDPDKFAYGDLPYACEAPYSRSVNDFLGPTRVVARLPDVTRAATATSQLDPRYLVGVLRTATKYKPVGHDVLCRYFAVTAQVWEHSTQRSLLQLFNDDQDLQYVPPSSYKWSKNLIRNRVHFFNCHGASGSSRFYGQPVKNRKPAYPYAVDASYMDGKLLEGTIAAAECCYGGQLYPLSENQAHLGVCNVYLKNKCYGFFASTTIAYGPAIGNKQADLICRYFIESILDGASIGRAALEARQTFVRTGGALTPADLKTIAQFNLYGDPSLTPMRPEPDQRARLSLGREAERIKRQQRRHGLSTQGRILEESTPKVRRRDRKVPAVVLRTLRAKGRIAFRPSQVMSFAISRHQPKRLARGPRMKDSLPNAFHVVLVRRRPPQQDGESRPPRIRGLIAEEANGKVASVMEILSR